MGTMKICARCGAEFARKAKQPRQRFCSKRCAGRARGMAARFHGPHTAEARAKMSIAHRALKLPLVHGTVHGYGRHGCRCQPCKAAKALQAQAYRTRDYDAALLREAAIRDRNRLVINARRRAAGNSTIYIHRRRARRLGNGGSHTAQEWREKRELFAQCCAYCGEAKPLTQDHRIPIVRGGTDDISNILPACRSCNLRKGKRTDREFLGLVPR